MTTATENQRSYEESDTINEIAARLLVNEAKAKRLWEAMGAVYDLLSDDGLTDGFGGMESKRVIPDALDYIRREANASPRTPDRIEAENERLRWGRAASWARGQSFGPRANGVDPRECERIERLGERIEEVGEDQAWDEYEAAKNGASS